MNFNCVSLNVRGLNQSNKIRKIFRWLYQQNAQIVLLQEIFSTKEVEIKWRNEWGGQMFYSHSSNHSKGVAILIKPNQLNIELNRTIHDKSGRFLIMEAGIEQTDITFANIDAPNDNANQINFFKNLQERLREFSGDNMIRAGHFNCPLTALDKSDGKEVGVKTSVINEIQKLMSLHDLSDVWRDLYPQQTSFTWRDKALKVQSRLDYFLVSKIFKSSLHKCDIFFAPLSDHSAVSCSIRSDNYQKQRGPGFWTFNASLLSDNKYVVLLKENIYQSKIDYCNIEDKSLKWDLIKMEISAFAIRYSKRKARIKRIEEKEILDAINACQKKLDKQTANDALRNEINSLKHKLDKILEEKIKGTILRSKIR